MSTTTTTNRTSARPPTAGTASDERLHPTQDILTYVREYARQKPDVTALWCFGLGIVVGWKAKPW